MYSNILIAFDGSELAEKALNHGIALAKLCKARATIVYATVPWAAMAVGELAVVIPPQEYEANVAKQAREQLKRAMHAAAAAGVGCETVHSSEGQPYKAIVDTASAKGCDLIVMGSHGRRGLAGLLIGSVAMQTLTHAHIPVLVYRD